MIEEQNINQLPKDWKWVKLGDACSFIGGGTPSKKESGYWNGDIFWASVKDVKGDYLNSTEDTITETGLKNSASNIAEPNDVILITRISPGKSIMTNVRTAINQDLKIVKPKFKTTSKFISYYFKSIERQLINKSSGTTVLGITLNNLNEIRIPLLNLATQNILVSKIEELFSELDKGIEQLKTAQQQLKTYRQSVLKWAFEGKLTNDDVGEGELPEGWQEKEIKDVCENIKVGIVIKPSSFYSKNENGIKAFRSANVREFQINDNDWVYFTEEGNEINYRTKLKEGDVLLVRSGYPGTSCIVSKRFEGANAIDILIATPNKVKIIPEYLCCFNNSPLGKGMFKSKSRGVAQKHLNVGEYSKLKISFPSIREQHQIVQEIESRLSVADKMEESITQSLQQAEALRQSILKKAFEGKLV